MAFVRSSLQSSWASLLRRNRPAPTARYPEARSGLTPEGARQFLQLLDQRLAEIDDRLADPSRIAGPKVAFELEVERQAVRGMREAFLLLLAVPGSPPGR